MQTPLKETRKTRSHMVADEFPIGQSLIAVSAIEDKEFGGSELCFEKIQLCFQNMTVALLPLADTDEIEIVGESMTASPPDKYAILV